MCVQVNLRDAETVAGQLRRVDIVLAAWKARKAQRLLQHRALKVRSHFLNATDVVRMMKDTVRTKKLGLIAYSCVRGVALCNRTAAGHSATCTFDLAAVKGAVCTGGDPWPS